MSKFIVLCLASLAIQSRAAEAQTSAPFQVSAQATSVRSGEFESAEIGFGGRLSWNPLASLGVESEINLYPGDYPDGVAFSGSRIEGRFGATVGPRLQRVRPFARLRAGFLRFGEAPEPVVCILIYPPPLSCLMAIGGTRPIFDLGGGIEVSTGARTFFRLDAGDRMVRYPGPSFGDGLTLRKTAFFSHDFRFALGAGLRF